MTTVEQQRREDLAYNLYCAREALAACDPGDINGRSDILHRLRAIEAELGTVDEKALADFVLKKEEAEQEQLRLGRERYYEKTGLIIHGD
jgi:hypothetical protein